MAKLSAAELAKREDVIMKMKKNKRGLVKRYGSDAEKVMYGRATNIAKKVTETQMEKSNLKELVRAALMQEKAGFSKEFDSDPALKGGQKNLPDGLQKSIIKKEKGVKEDLDLGHEDNEPHMIKGELYRIGKYAMELYQMVDGFEEMGGEIDFPAWWQSKITTAMNNMVSAKHYLDFETKEPEIDAAVDVIDASDALNSTDINEATKMYYHVIEDVDGEKGWQGAYDTQEEAEKRADKLQDMFPRSFFYVEAYDSASEPYNITLEEGLPKGYFKKATAELDESFEKLVGKLKKGGKSEKTAKAIAGAVASYKAKGGGKGPTSKQKARVNEESEQAYYLTMDKYTPGFDEIKNSVFYKYKVVYYKDTEGAQPFAQTIFKYEPEQWKIDAAMRSSNDYNKVKLYKVFDKTGKETPVQKNSDEAPDEFSILKALGFKKAPELGWQAG
jgi:hypothetical protein